MAISANHPLLHFDPDKIAKYEKDNYVAYYQKDWVTLMRVSVGMVKEAFQLNTWQALWAAYLVARAEIAFAPFPKNDIAKAEAFMRRFFTLIKQAHHLDIDIEEAACREVHWWSVHRKLFGNAENDELVQALAEAYAAAYGLERSRLYEAAYHRALGMLCSDRWVNEGRSLNSPLLQLEEQELARGYEALKFALQAKAQ